MGKPEDDVVGKTSPVGREDATKMLACVPLFANSGVGFDLLRVWIADRYQVDSNEIAFELGLDPEPNWFGTDEGDLDHDPEQNRENRDRWRAWKESYDHRVKIDPDRYRRILAKISLKYADELLWMAGITRESFRAPDPFGARG